MTTDRFRILLCVDCVQVDANGTDDLPIDAEWSGFLPEWQNSGWLWGADPDASEDGHVVRPGSPCDGCGTTLGGMRYDYIAVKR